MSTRTLLGWALVVVACGAPAPERAMTTSTVAEVATAPFLDGARRAYDVEWEVTAADGRAEMVPGAVSLSGGLALEGTLALAGVGREGDAAIVELHWVAIDRAAITMLGTEIEIDAAELLGARAWLVVPPDGEVQRVLFAADASPIFRQTTSGLVGHIDLRTSLATTRQSRVVPAGHGLAEAEYVADGTGRVVRRLDRYVRFDAYATTSPPQARGETSIVLDGAGVPVAIDGREQVVDDTGLRRADDRFVLRARPELDVEAAAAPDLATLVEHDPTAAPDDAQLLRQIALQSAQGLVPDDIAIVVGGIDDGVRARSRTISRATGLLRAKPEIADEMRAIFHGARTSHGRAYVLDVLTSAGTPEAQTVMRDLLDDEDVRADPDYDAFVQRFGLLRDPQPQTAEWVVRRFDDAAAAQDDVLLAAFAYPLGSVSGRLWRDPVLAELLHARLVDLLATADTTKLRDAAIAGLGNAGSARDLERIAGFLDHGDASTRMNAVAALRFLDTDRARQLVVGMLADRERVVASRALGVLQRYVDDDLAAPLLATAAARGAHHPEIRDALVAAVSDRG